MANRLKRASLGLIVPLICLAACSALLSPFEKSDQDRATASHPGADHTGTLEIIFNQTGISTVLPPEVFPADLKFDLTLNPIDIPGQEEIDLEGLSESELFVPGIFPGTWSVSLRGYFPEGTPPEGVTPEVHAFSATEDVTILQGVPTQWSAQLLALQTDEGEGSVKIELFWNDSELVTEWMDDSAEPSPSLQRLIPGGTHQEPVHIDPQTITFNGDAGTLIYEESGLESGFHRIVITLERHDADTNETFSVGTYRDVIHIYDSLRSEKTLDITPLIGIPPSAPENLQVSPVSFDETEEEWTVGLSWTRSVTAESYRIYRSEDGGAFELLADNLPRTTSSFETTQSTSIDSYQYRLVARNTYGNAQPLDSPTVPGDLQAIEGDFTFHIHSDYLILSEYIGSDPEADVEIPATATIGGVERTVKKIAAQAFLNKEIGGTLTIPDSITEIGAAAFRDNNFTGDLIIPDSVTSIGINAFRSAGFDEGNLTLGTTGSNLGTIGAGAFIENNFAGGLIIPDSVTSIGGSAFSSAGFDGPLTLETTESNLDTIGASAFRDSNFTGNLTIPDSVTTIGLDAFRSAGFDGTLTLGTTGSNLGTIGATAFQGTGFTGNLTIPDSVTTIGHDAFRSIEFGGNLTLGTGMETIGTRSFQFVIFTGDLTIPDSVITIEQEAFRWATFTGGSLSLGTGLKTIGNSAFLDNATRPFAGNLTIPDSVITIGDSAFLNREFTGHSHRYISLGTTESALETIGNRAFEGTNLRGPLEIPGTVTSIGEKAFFELGISGDLVIPDSVITIGAEAFRDNSFRNDDPDFRHTLTLGTEHSKLETIGASAFRDNRFYGNLVIPDSVITIGEGAFQPDNVNDMAFMHGNLTLGTSLQTIGASAFESTRLRGNLTIPDSVTTIGDRAFFNTPQFGPSEAILTLGTENSKLETIGSEAFRVSNFTGELTIPNSVKIIGENAFNGSFDGATLTLGTSLETVGNGAFQGNNFTGGLTIPDSVTSIGQQAFGNNSFTGDLTIPVTTPDPVTIGIAAFQESGFDGTLTLGNLTDISTSAFRGTGFTSVTIPGSVTRIWSDAFRDIVSPGFQSLTFEGGSDLEINVRAFQNASTQITEITIPARVTNIGGSTFRSWSALATVTVMREDPPDAGTGIFAETPIADTESSNIFVPEASVATYQTADGWAEYAARIESQ
ncbi:Leucine rich repeat-containing protein [Alkalispirochaeta americana]|uniref:Leucine rich repeat-containing protein n=1 Tax=Alkalispirochaeta americana TaxID=159291 RepID=A0A1N6PQ21_9SPIO|nr:leucine-rich repeat protein [Alkalispirochaeta americana]SIQ06445.1 Leucine rich repeat-containing protein [Alkalispirochaeta americana]